MASVNAANVKLEIDDTVPLTINFLATENTNGHVVGLNSLKLAALKVFIHFIDSQNRFISLKCNVVMTRSIRGRSANATMNLTNYTHN